MRDLIPSEDLPPDTAPFRDANFKLAVMSELIETRVLDFGDFAEFLRFIEGPQYNYQTDGYASSAHARDYLARYPLSKRHLDTVQFLELDGALVIYDYIQPFRDGENDTYDIADLYDLRHLPNLERLNIASMLATTDLKPIRTAPRLERVSLGSLGTWENLDALLGLPRLTHLSLSKSGLKSRFRNPVLKVLKEKGVNITLFR